MVTQGDRTNREGWPSLMAAAQDGDRAAYERLLRETVPFIRAVVSAQHRGERIEDIVQDVLLTVHRVRHTYDPTRPFDAWLATIARRRSIDALRRRVRLAELETKDDFAYETFADPGANKELDRTVRTSGLGEAIASLSESQREAIELLKVRDLSLREASQVSGKSIAALKVNVHRAIKSLRERLKGESGTNE
jgi:RNA polymerase sigma-70 factor (ECF subfamily)